MPFQLDQVIPWGRSGAEYERMFALEPHDLPRRILGCADGPASFNREWTARGGRVVSFDLLYEYDAAEIRARIEACFPIVLEQTRQNRDAFAWSDVIPDIPHLARVRRNAMDLFLADYELGRQEGRYVAGELPELPFQDGEFDLAVCSHFLFLYEMLGSAFHQAALQELLRVANEVRIFPLLQLDGRESPFVAECRELCRTIGVSCERRPVAYEFQRGAREMLMLGARPTGRATNGA